MHLNKAQNLLEELQREEKSGFKIADNSKKSESKESENGKSRHKKSAEDDIDNYDEDFDDEIEEDLPEGQNEDPYEQDGIARSTNVGGSG